MKKRICASTGKYGGSETVYNMFFNFTAYTLTLGETTRIRKTVEDDGTTPDTCDTQKLIDYLSHNDDICYAALYYEVDDTTLFAVKIAKKKQQNKAQIRCQCEKENIPTASSNYVNGFNDNGKNDNTVMDIITNKLWPHNNEGNFWEPQGKKCKSQPVERLGNYISDDMLKVIN